MENQKQRNKKAKKTKNIFGKKGKNKIDKK